MLGTLRGWMAFVMATLATGCALRAQVAGPDRAPTVRRDPFVYPRVDPTAAVLEADARESEGYTTSTLTFPAHDRGDPLNLVVRAKLRVPEDRAHTLGLVVVLPILGGDYAPSDAFARDLAERGFVTLRFDRKDRIFDPDRDFTWVARRIRAGVIDIRRGIDFVQYYGHPARGGVGLLGISMGSFAGALVAATDARVASTVLALGGGGLVDALFSAQDEEEIKALIDALRARGWSEARILREAHASLDRLDPLQYVGQLAPSATLMFHARFDAVVPYHLGTNLWRAAGRPRRQVLLTGHYTSVLALPYLLAETARHFRARLPRADHRFRKRPDWD